MIRRFRPHLLIAIAMAMTLASAMAMLPPIPQDPGYHHFADARTLLGIANFCKVVSNIPFLLVGVAGLRWVVRNYHRLPGQLQRAYLVLFLGVGLVGLGSSWYHLKLLEQFDAPVYATLGAISGHSLKHVVAAGAMWALLVGLRRRVVEGAAVAKT